MMCAFLTLLGLIALVWLLFSWGVMRFIAIVGYSEYPSLPDDSADPAGPDPLDCPQCGKTCSRCRHQDGAWARTYVCGRCGWIGPRPEESCVGFYNDEGERDADCSNID